MDQKDLDIIDRIIDEDSRYRAGAYEFVMEALSFTRRRFKTRTHVSGEQLLEGIRDLTMRRFGPLALTVLHHWGVHSTEDFGHIVFNLVRFRLLSRRAEDSIDSFRNGYNFEETFRKGYRRQLEKEIKSIR